MQLIVLHAFRLCILAYFSFFIAFPAWFHAYMVPIIVNIRQARLVGILAISGAVLLLSLSDALVKLFSDAVSLGQVLVLRSAVATVILAIVFRLTGGRGGRFFSANPWVWARSFSLALMWGSYYAALPFISFSLAAACYYTSPIWMTVLSAILCKAYIGRRGVLAIALGFAGVLVLLRPGPDALSPVMVLPLLAGFFYALAAVITYGRCRDVSPLSMAINLNVVLAAAGLAYVAALFLSGAGDDAGFLLSVWPPLDRPEWQLLTGLGVLLAVITAAVALAYQLAPAPVIGLFDNGYLVFALVWGLLLFGDRPGLPDLAGIALIGGGAFLASLAPIGTGSGPKGE
ncbi:DMT family transporter [Martelella mediterranea]|uniref:DMT family transporter n=1 Tax=Martelella mediterranea TaxID=293089 RepID=UPI001E347C37|nr:DMT family transporter [Martelella mediterranea]